MPQESYRPFVGPVRNLRGDQPNPIIMGADDALNYDQPLDVTPVDPPSQALWSVFQTKGNLSLNVQPLFSTAAATATIKVIGFTLVGSTWQGHLLAKYVLAAESDDNQAGGFQSLPIAADLLGFQWAEVRVVGLSAGTIVLKGHVYGSQPE